MADADLEEIRRARLAQLKEQSGGQGGGSDGNDAAQKQQDAEAQARQSILSQILTPEAADRLGRIRLVKPARAEQVEARLVTLARTGQIRQKVGEEELKGFLERVAEVEEQQRGGGRIEVVRRGGGGWDEDDDLEAMLND